MNNNIRLVQLRHAQHGRRVAVVNEPHLVWVNNAASVYGLALESLDENVPLSELIASRLSAETLLYDDVYYGNSEWSLLPSFDHPVTPSHCMVSGTGLTHKNSALNRQMMHGTSEETLTDSMKMYQWGVEGGHPANGDVGVQPEWFYKGTGEALRAHGQSLAIPDFGNDGGEEPEVAGVYVVDRAGKPWRIGFTTGNEFSDHVMEKKNYLYLAPSKLRSCAIGPELVLTTDFHEIKGAVSVSRNGEELWRKNIHTGEKNMAHSLRNLEHHHFKYEGHRLPLQAHVHFFGADAFSFGAGIELAAGDEMKVEWYGLGRALQNPLLTAAGMENLVTVTPMG